MFEDVIATFDEYYRLLDHENSPGFIRDLGCEVRERLQQLDYMITRVRDAESAANKALSTTPIQPFLGHVFEMKLMAESFYFFAARVRSILKHGSRPIPGLNNFECEGVRNVRNKLIEHPEGRDSQIFIRSWAWGASRGPVLKAVRHGGQEDVFPDPGLYANAEEFRDNLMQVLKHAIKSRSARAL
jgi:hypothetical protein